MTRIRCSQCGSEDLEPGFVEDGGHSARGYERWMPGQVVRNSFGAAMRAGKPTWQVDAWRCLKCSHLELFAGTPD